MRGRGKGTLYEGGVRVAACAAWEGRIKPGSVAGAPLHIVDWYPTILRLAGVSVKQKLPLDGLDAWAALTQGKASPHTEILLNSTPNTGAIRVGDWKLILNGTVPADENARGDEVKTGRQRVELFNLANDPYEKQNLSEQQPGKVEELLTRYNKLAAQAVPPKLMPRPAGFKVPKVWGEQ